MRDLKNKLTSGKNVRNTQTRRTKSFGYQVLGFGSGGPTAKFITATGGSVSDFQRGAGPICLFKSSKGDRCSR